MSDMSEFCTELMHWLDGGRSPWHTVAMAEQALTAQGFTDIQTTGYAGPFACSKDDFYSTGFIATNPQGQRVKGVACSGFFFKSTTIRW